MAKRVNTRFLIILGIGVVAAVVAFFLVTTVVRKNAATLIREGDAITIDAHQLKLELHVAEAELAERRKGWKAPAPRYTRGVQAKFAFNASSASQGAVLDNF